MAWAAQSGGGRLRLAAGQIISLMNRQAAAEPGRCPSLRFAGSAVHRALIWPKATNIDGVFGSNFCAFLRVWVHKAID